MQLFYRVTPIRIANDIIRTNVVTGNSVTIASTSRNGDTATITSQNSQLATKSWQTILSSATSSSNNNYNNSSPTMPAPGSLGGASSSIFSNVTRTMIPSAVTVSSVILPRGKRFSVLIIIDIFEDYHILYTIFFKGKHGSFISYFRNHIVQRDINTFTRCG